MSASRKTLVIRHSWTAEEDAILFDLIDKGIKSPIVLAGHIPGRTRIQVDRRIRRGRNSVRRGTTHTLWTDEEVTLAFKLRKKGHSWDAIGARMGRSGDVVRRRVQSLGGVERNAAEKNEAAAVLRGLERFAADLAAHHPNGPPNVNLAPSRYVPFRARSLTA